MNTLRRTGRTTRMLEEALRLHYKEGKEVWIIAKDTQQIQLFKDRLYPETGVNIAGPLQVNFSMGRYFIRNASIHATILVDHSVIEMDFHGLLTELHKYDEE